MRVLIVDDSMVKTNSIANFIKSSDSLAEVVHATNAHDGYEHVFSGNFDLVFLDVVLPLSTGGNATEEGSLWFVNEIHRKIAISSMPMIVGTTQYEGSIAKVEEKFRNYLRSVVYVGGDDERWSEQLRFALRLAKAQAENRYLVSQSGEGQADVAIMTALSMPEFSELSVALGGGHPVHIAETGEEWLRCTLSDEGGREVNVIAACAQEMGMSAMAALTTRLAVAYRPKIMMLVGIMGGNAERVGISDIVVVKETWNSTAGKLTERGFQPDMKQQTCDLRIANIFGSVINDDVLLHLWRNWKDDKPKQLPTVHQGAVACSSAVVADGAFFKDIENQKRKILGVEMEAYGCYDASFRLGNVAPKTICFKSVCDLGDGAKNDQYQRYCSYIAASVAVILLRESRFVDALGN
jgi:nucleoside phosphorylase/CheY-like chemotaxis protein